jgi:hypothetical protein
MKLLVPVLFSVLVATVSASPCVRAAEGSQAKGYQPVIACSVCESTSMYHIKCEYPLFPSLSASFNEHIESSVQTRIDAFKEACTDNWSLWQEMQPASADSAETTSPFVFIASWEPDQLNEQYVSFLFSIYYFAGGAHGNDVLDTFNYDVAEQRELYIGDLLGHSKDALQKISQISAKDILGQLASQGWKEDEGLKQMVAEGAKPTVSNYKEFTFDDYNLTIYFQRYQVAPGAAGTVRVKIPRSRLSGISSGYSSCPNVP